MKNEKRIFLTWLVAIGAAITGAVVVSCSSLDTSGSSGGGHSPASAPAAPC